MKRPVPVVISWTARSHCTVCEGTDRVTFRWRDGRLSGHGVSACPHSCDPRRAIPIASLPWMQDVPRQEAA